MTDWRMRPLEILKSLGTACLRTLSLSPIGRVPRQRRLNRPGVIFGGKVS